MNTRNFGSGSFDTKGFSMSTTIGGRTYAVCDNAQFLFLMEMAIHKHGHEIASLAAEMAARGEEFDDHVLKEMASQWVENEDGFSTVKRLLVKMTPEERERWKTAYRFTPFHTKQLGLGS